MKRLRKLRGCSALLLWLNKEDRDPPSEKNPLGRRSDFGYIQNAGGSDDSASLVNLGRPGDEREGPA